jgi:imidazoleglycerol phosphate synthase glutamine amidotransferase subunit HisH
VTRIAILDYGMGNLRSAAKALEHVGARPEVTNDHGLVRRADGVVLPGVGAMPKAMERVRGLGLVSWHRQSALNAGLPNPCPFYHANSFAPRPAHADDVLGTADYGGEFISAVARPPVYGVQFHPEKSGPHGLALLGNFVRAAVPAVA